MRVIPIVLSKKQAELICQIQMDMGPQLLEKYGRRAANVYINAVDTIEDELRRTPNTGRKRTDEYTF